MSHLRILLTVIVLSSFGLASLWADEQSPAASQPEQQLLSLADQKLDIAKLAKVPARTYTIRITMRPTMKDTIVTEGGKLTLSQRIEEDQLMLHEKNDYADRYAPMDLDLYENTLTVHDDGLLSMKKCRFVQKMDLTLSTRTFEGKQVLVSRIKSLDGIPEEFHGKIVDYSVIEREVRQGQIHFKVLVTNAKPVKNSPSLSKLPAQPYAENTLTPAAFLRVVQLLPADPKRVYKVDHYADPNYADMRNMMSLGSLTLRYEKPERIRIGKKEHDCHRFVMTPDKTLNPRFINCVWRAWVDQQGVLQKFELWNFNTIFTGTLGDPGPIEGGDGYINMMKKHENKSVPIDD